MDERTVGGDAERELIENSHSVGGWLSPACACGLPDPGTVLSLCHVSQLVAGIQKGRRMQSNTNSSVQVECLLSQSLGQGSNCTNSLDPNVTSVNSSGDIVLAELISSVLEGKDFGEDTQVTQNYHIKLVRHNAHKTICRRGKRSSKMV